MAGVRCGSNKAKFARRVIEVLEYFDDAHTEVTVMDIVRRYNRPQSSTSELLSSLVELGLLHKDPRTRSYRPTARTALMGTAGQPEIVRDGRLMRLMGRLSAKTGLAVSLIGKVGLDSLVIDWRHGVRAPGCTLFPGRKESLARNSAGQLMLSTVTSSKCDGMLRRLRAEADDEHRFPVAEMAARIAATRNKPYMFGAAGFGLDAESMCVLVPDQAEGHPLVISLVYGRDEQVNREVLLQSVGEAMCACRSC